MKNNLKKKFKYVKQMVEDKSNGIYCKSHSEWYYDVFGERYSEDVARRQFYGVRKMVNFLYGEESDFEYDFELEEKRFIKDSNIDKLLEDNNAFYDGEDYEEIDDLDKKYIRNYNSMLALQKERVIRNDYNSSLKKEITKYTRLEILIDECEKYYKENRSLKEYKKKDLSIFEKDAHIMISDVHLGLNVSNKVNIFNEKECIKRFETLANDTLRALEEANTKHINITFGGDLINGVINTTNRVEQECDTMQQILKVSDILSNFVLFLDKNGISIDIRGVVGNHSRMFEDKKKSIKNENFEVIVFKMVELSTGIVVETNDFEDFINFSIMGRDIVCSHGDKDGISNAKQNYVNVLDKKIDEIWLGHYHFFQIRDDNNTEIIINGSVIGSDDYALSIRKNTKPCQILRIYEEKNTITKKIYL